MALTPKQRRFVDEYLVDLNGTQAAVRAGYSRRTANRIASENLSKPDVQSAVAAAQRARAERTKLSQDRVIEELAAIAFSDIRKMFDVTGKLLPPHDLPDDVAAAVASLVIQTPHDVGGVGVRVRLSDKLRALEMLGRHLGMFKDPKPGVSTVTVDASKLAHMTDEEIASGIANADKLLAALAAVPSER